MAAIIFYASGHLFIKNVGHQKFEQFVNRKRWFSFLLMLVLYVIIYYGGLYNGKVSMGHASIHNPFIFYPIAFIGVFAFIIMCSLIAQSRVNEYKWLQGVKWFGQNSFIAMVIHNPIKGFVIVALASLLGMEKMAVMRGTWTAILALLITLLATTAIMILIVRIKSKRKVVK